MITQLRSPAERERIQKGWISDGNGGFFNVFSGQQIRGMAGGAAATNVRGGAYDVRDLKPNVAVAVVGERLVADYLQDVLEFYNEELADIRAEIVGDEIVEHKIGIEREAGGLYLQPADEYSRPDAFRSGGRTWLYYPLQQYQRRTAWTRTYLMRATVGDLLRTQQQLVAQDVRTLIRDAVLALLRNDQYVVDDEMYGDLTIVPFMNGDSFVPPPFLGVTFTAPHNHYMATNGALVAADIATTGRNHLVEHGFGNNVVALCDPFLEDEIRALAEFKERADPTVIIPAGDTNEYANPAFLRPDAIGRVGQVQIVLKPWMPANYIFMYDQTGGAPLLERIHELDEMRGFNLVANEGKFPLRDAFYERWTGFAVNNRINGFAIFVDAGATYATPQVLLDTLVVG